MGFFSASEKKLKLPSQYYAAMDELLKLGKAPAPSQPLRGTAELSPLELQAQQMVTDWIGAPVPETRRVATEETLKTATQPVDITKLPEYQGMLDQIIEEGNLMANRLGRGLQTRGMWTSEPARDILGRSVTGTQKRMVGALAPFAESERQRRFAATSMLEQLTQGAESTLTKKIGLAGGIGALPRQIQQQVYDALFDKRIREIAFKYQIQPEILKSILGGSVGHVTGGEPSMFSQIISPLTGAGSGGGFTGGGGTVTPTTGNQGTIPYQYLGGYGGGYG